MEAGAALYRKDTGAPPANAFIAAVAQTHEKGPVEIWPENWKAFEVFYQLRTQWNVAMGGPTGLRYEAMYPLIDKATTSAEDWWALFDDLQVLEGAALGQMQDGGN